LDQPEVSLLSKRRLGVQERMGEVRECKERERARLKERRDSGEHCVGWYKDHP